MTDFCTTIDAREAEEQARYELFVSLWHHSQRDEPARPNAWHFLHALIQSYKCEVDPDKLRAWMLHRQSRCKVARYVKASPLDETRAARVELHSQRIRADKRFAKRRAEDPGGARCAVPGCERPSWSRGICTACSHWIRRHPTSPRGRLVAQHIRALPSEAYRMPEWEMVAKGLQP